MLDFFNQTTVFGLIGGLGLFLFGMKTLSDGLQKVAGDRMRHILASFTDNRLVGALVGLTVTAIIQSSSATAVLVIGFVNAGVMTLLQAIGVMLGSNIGTTVTAQLLALKISQFALPVIGIGAGLKLFCRRKNIVHTGEILLGFGILFFGLATMKTAFEPLKGSADFADFFLSIGHSHLLALACGALLTLLVQSSSATIGVTMALASSGLLSFDASIALILGENIGTAITANLAAVGSSLAARRAALAHMLFNGIGVALAIMFLPAFIRLVDTATPGNPNLVIHSAEQALEFGAAIGDKPNIIRHIANAHSIFNVINTLLFIPLLGMLAKTACLLYPGKEQASDVHIRYIDPRVLNTPPIALGQANSETRRMAHLTLDMLDETMCYFTDSDSKHLASLTQKESLVDLLQKEITDFLVKLSQKSITQDMSHDVAAMIHMVNDLERVGDHCEGLWNLAQRLRTLGLPLSPTALEEVDELAEKTRQFLHFVIQALDRRDATIAPEADEMIGAIDRMEDNLRNNHIARLNTGECSVQQGLIFIDILHGFSKIASHSYNVSKIISGVE